MLEMTATHWWAFGAFLVVFVLIVLMAVMKVLRARKLRELAELLEEAGADPEVRKAVTLGLRELA
jgi:hypothetical protein